MTTPNAELAYRVLDLITANPEALDMGQWASSAVDPVSLADLTEGPGCGTTACFAGWALAAAGYRVTRRGAVYDGDGKGIDNHIQSFAAGVLGLTEDQSDDLFFTDDEYLTEAVAEIFGPRPDGGA